MDADVIQSFGSSGSGKGKGKAQKLCGYFTTTRRSGVHAPSIRDVGLLRRLSSSAGKNSATRHPILLILGYAETHNSWVQEFPYSCFCLAGETRYENCNDVMLRCLQWLRDYAAEQRASQSSAGGSQHEL